MVVLVKKTLSHFSKIYPTSANALNKWHLIVTKANWNKFTDITRDFNSVDYVGQDRYVFNIKGNDFRLVAMIFFDQIDCSTI